MMWRLVSLLVYVGAVCGQLPDVLEGSTDTPMGSKKMKCDRVPSMVNSPPQVGDNGYEVKVRSLGSGHEISRFESGHTYEISITNRYPSVAFINFYLTAVPESVPLNMEMGHTLGVFSHVPNPPVTQHSPGCPGMVEGVHYNSPIRLYNVKVHWTAPNFATECVDFRSTVEAYAGEYFKDQGMLRKRICPHPSMLIQGDQPISGRRDRQGPKMIIKGMKKGMEQYHQNKMDPKVMMPEIRECCACGHATYQMEFQGLWTRQNHPKDWPKGESLVHWSNIIGASHNRDYLIYYNGGRASTAVKAMCELGDVGPMEREFRDDARWNVLNVIKTSGIWGLRRLGEARSALFSVNQTHHLMSMLTMLGPSPDWCTGVSALDLCASGCQWKQNISIDLYPWDAGTSRGNTYEPAGRKAAEDRSQPIKNIASTWMEGQPFTTDGRGKVKRVARLFIQRIRPKMDWECDSLPMPGVVDPGNQGDQGRRASRGKGRRGRKGRKRRPDWQKTPGERSKEEMGMGLLQPMMLKKLLMRCKLSQWSEWSSCSITCGGSGVRIRTRKLTVNLIPEKCKLFQTKKTEVCLAKTRVCPFEKCAVTGWSSWSPCAGTCSTVGTKRRRREFRFTQFANECGHLDIMMTNITTCRLPGSQCDPKMICPMAPMMGKRCFNDEVLSRYYYNIQQRRCLPFQFKGCKGNNNNFESREDCLDFCKKGLSTVPGPEISRLARKQQTAIMVAAGGSGGSRCEKVVMSGRQCRLGERGPMASEALSVTGQGGHLLWYFDMGMRLCKPFTYLGCGGNPNRFASEMDCMRSCKYLVLNAGEAQDCRVSSWGSWQPCTRRCGGQRKRERRITEAAKFGGQSCPVLFQSSVCPQCCRYKNWSAWSSCSATCRDSDSFIPPMRERSRRRMVNDRSRCNALPLTERQLCAEENATRCPTV